MMNRLENSRRAGNRDAARNAKRPAPKGPRRMYIAGALGALVLVAVAVAVAGLDGVTKFAPGGAANARAPARVVIGAPAPDIRFSTLDGKQRRLSEFRGRAVMLWFYATWCPTCVVGTAAVVGNFDRLKGLQIIQLRLYENLGYPGPSVAEFARRYAGPTLGSPDWLWGEASREASFTYDPRGVPDIYFLIGKDGIVRAIEPAPHVTMDKILAFVQGLS